MQRNHLFLLSFLVILNLMFLVQSYPSIAASPEKRVALVIGNSAYQNTPPLANPRNDATEMGKVLKRIGFDVDVVVDATKPQMDQALRRFGNNLAGSIAAVFYYAGHGIQVDGINYILPVDVTLKTERDLSWEVSDLTTVLKQMEGHNRVNLLFLDACRDNPMSQTLARSMGESRSSVIGRGLAPMKANAGTLISYSTKEGEVAADGKGKHSPYTEALLKHIEVPGVEIGLMLRKVREDVIAATKNKQVPWEYGSLLGEFYFTGPVTIQVQHEKEQPASTSKLEALYWESIMNNTNPAVFEAYLKKYPNGEFTELALIKIADLKNEPVKTSTAMGTASSSYVATKSSDNLKLSSDPVGADAARPLSRYIKMDNAGKSLPDVSTSWAMVRDNGTGLTWEVKQNKDGIKKYDDPNDADNTYLWFESDQKFIKALNAANWCGFSDWRLPSSKELNTLVDSSGTSPTINTAYFPNTQSSFYWSSTTDNDNYGTRVDFGNGPSFGYGYGNYFNKSPSYYVRAVRGGH